MKIGCERPRSEIRQALPSMRLCERRTPARSASETPLLSLPLEGLLESPDSHIEDAGLDDAFVVGADEGQVVGGQFE